MNREIPERNQSSGGRLPDEREISPEEFYFQTAPAG